MRTKMTSVCLISLASILSFNAQATTALSGEFTVGLGPVTLGDVVMTSDCNADICHYETRIKGSFMFISAKINEKGTFKTVDNNITPVNTEYSEKIGSKKKAFNYDFLTRKINDKKKNRQFDIPDNAFPYIPLLNQVVLDLHAGAPREAYDFVSQHKIKQAVISDYTKKQTEDGILHHFIGTRKDSELEFFFVENTQGIELQKIAYGSFHMSKKKPSK